MRWMKTVVHNALSSWRDIINYIVSLYAREDYK